MTHFVNIEKIMKKKENLKERRRKEGKQQDKKIF